METLTTCVKLCEAGVNPEALAAVIKEIRRESTAIQVMFGHSRCVIGLSMTRYFHRATVPERDVRIHLMYSTWYIDR